MKKFEGFVEFLNKFMCAIAGVTLVSVMLLTVLDVTLRYFGHPITGVYDLVALGGAIVIGFSMPYAAEKRVHVYMEMVTQKFNSGVRNILEVLTRLVAATISWLVAWNLIKLGMGFRVTGESSLTIQISYYPIAIGLGICFFTQILAFVLQISQVFSGGSDE